MSDATKAGIIGCGNICQAYLDTAKKLQDIDIVACSDISMEACQAKADENDIKAMTVDQLLADPEIEMVINLTIPAVHAELSCKILEAGKHVHSEKPLALTRAEAQQILDLAKSKNLRVGCAPDTFLGGGLQTCRKIVDDGWLGKVVSGTAMFMGHGPEAWHPNPAFFYQKGAGPMFDMGPYYITALLHLLGPVKRVAAMTGKAYETRIATCEEKFGLEMPVDIPTHQSGTLEFASGALITVITSFDVWSHKHPVIELHGTDGSMQVPDPNSFAGKIELFKPGAENWVPVPYSHQYAVQNMRSLGAADMAKAIQSGREHRCSGELAYHALDVMISFEDSCQSGQAVELASTCKQPAPMPMHLIEGFVE